MHTFQTSQQDQHPIDEQCGIMLRSTQVCIAQIQRCRYQ